MKDISGYEGLYAVTKNGKVWGYPKNHIWHEGRWLKFYTINGYQVTSLYKNKVQKKFLVHRLVALTYIPNPLKLKTVNHKNGNKSDNRLQNLEWATHKENSHHAWDKGLYTHKGEKHTFAKLNPDKVRKIRESYKSGISGVKIAKLFKVSTSTIYELLRGENWSHVK